MAYTIYKASGAPAGTIHFTTSFGAFTIDDSTPITTSDQATAYELAQNPFLDLDPAGGAPYVPAPIPLPVAIVDGVLSYWNGTAYVAAPGGGGGGNFSTPSTVDLDMANHRVKAVAAPAAATDAANRNYVDNKVSNVAFAANPDSLIVGTIVRDANGAATSASVVWPDGTPGTYTGTPSLTFAGSIDSYTITYGSPATKTYTQPTVTRDSSGAVTARPAITVT